MKRSLLLLVCLILSFVGGIAQIKIKLFSDFYPESVVFIVTEGGYSFLTGNGENIELLKGDKASIACISNILTVKSDSADGINTPFIALHGITGKDAFSVTIRKKSLMTRYYSGDLTFSAGKGYVNVFNFCPSEDYIAGVVMAEGGAWQNIEYYKTQSVLARTYMYNYLEDNISEKDYLTDNTDCQVFFGITNEPAILKAVSETQGQVILGRDRTVIECPFHSNCGGLTSSSGDVWITHTPYLKSVTDPFCQTTRNATWTRSISLDKWIKYVKKAGYTGKTEDPTVFSFPIQSRSRNYLVGSFVLPFTRIRTEMNLPSAFFSVKLRGDSILLDGRGFGHGVGLCQEGAMKMARQGYSYKQIINFYYSGVLIADINKAAVLPKVLALLGNYERREKDQIRKNNSDVKSERFIIAASR